MKNLDILAITNAYLENKNKSTGRELKLPAAVAWKRRVNLDKLFAVRKLIDEAMADVKRRYTDDEHSVEARAENGELARNVRPKFMPEFIKAQAEILDQDTDVDIRKVRIEDLGDIELTDSEMDTLQFMIEE